MKIQIIEISRTKDKRLSALEGEYQKRLTPYAKIEEIILPASKFDDHTRTQNEEKSTIEKHLNPRAVIIALDEHGKEFTSQEFANFLGKHKDKGAELQFLIGGSHGLHPDVLGGATARISLSLMTMPHELVRVVFKEQLYRAFTILAGKPYHK